MESASPSRTPESASLRAVDGRDGLARSRLHTGGVWGWRPLYDKPSQVLSNLSAITIPQPPPYDLYCGGHAALPDGDLLVMSGTERGKTGKDQSARFDAMTLSWLPRSMNGRRWYGNATVMSVTKGAVIVVVGAAK